LTLSAAKTAKGCRSNLTLPGFDNEPADTVSVVEVESGRVIDTIRTGWGAHGVAVSRDGTTVFVSNIVDGTVSVIDTGSRRVIGNYKVGDGPNGITHRPADAKPASGSGSRGETSSHAR